MGMLTNSFLGKFALLLLAVSWSTDFCSAKTQRTDGLSGCEYSNSAYNYDAAVMQRRGAPTRFRLMTSRYLLMVQSVRSYPCTGTVTVGFDGHHYLQNGRSDDPGMMDLIPTLSRLLEMSLENTYDLTMLFVISLGLLIGYAGFWNLFPERRLRWAGAFVFLCIGIAEAAIADEYMFQVCPLIAGIPWLLHLGIQQKSTALTVSAALLAFCCSWCSLIRSGSFVICVTFLLTMFVARSRVQKTLLPVLLIFLACVPAVLVEQSLVAKRNAVLARFGETAISENGHPLWHTVYIGLGFIPNAEVSEYKDAVAEKRVRAIDRTAAYTSTRYEAILRHEVWGIVQRRSMLVIAILSAKTACIILLASILLYPARRLMFVEKTFFWFDAASILTLGMSAVNGIVAVPKPSYLLTFCCLGFLYSSIKVCRAAYVSKSPLFAQVF
jgi:hypothetical protein